MNGKWNTRSPAVKRILQELKEVQRDDNPDILAETLEDNIFEWHFVIRGAWDTEFEGGIYHGRILMPAEYPFKPPAFVMLTPSGRFETGVKICLSISSFHPESWQPSWSVRSALVALIAFMQTPGNGAVGSLDHPADVRKQIAAESRAKPPKHANPERQELINAMHQKMLDMEDVSRGLHKHAVEPSAETSSSPLQQQDGEQPTTTPSSAVATKPPVETTEEPESSTQEEEQVALLTPPPVAGPATCEAAPSATTSATKEPTTGSPETILPAPVVFPAQTQQQADNNTPSTPSVPISPPSPQQQQTPIEPQQQAAIVGDHHQHVNQQQQQQQQNRNDIAQDQHHQGVYRGRHVGTDHLHRAGVVLSWEDRGLTYLALMLVVCIVAIVLRRVLVSVRIEPTDEFFSVNPVSELEL